jgi:outer membrane protein, multidrug efflux system
VRASLLVALALGGCYSMAPKYERPAAPIPAQLPSAGTAAQGPAPASVAVGEFVREPRLQQVIAQALAQNRDLRRTTLAIEVARATYRIQRAEAYPSLDATASVVSTRAVIGPDNATIQTTQYGVGVGLATWEIDLFGRIKSLSDAKFQQYLSTVESARAARVSLVGETASAWLALAADRSRLAIAKETVVTAQKAMDLTEALVGGGASSRSDYWQASTVFQQARADVALITATLVQDRDALELLAGGPVGDALLPDSLPDALDWFAEVPSGLSSSVLLQRPDVLAAEHDLIAANANIGAARAQFFPSLTLTASGGLASLALGALFTGPAAIFTLAPAIGIPLFRGGANQANLDAAKAQKLVLIASYEGAIQRAFRDVADALATRATIDEQLSAQVALVDAAQKSFDLSQARYKAGLDPFLSTLVSERALYAAKNSLVTTQVAALGNRVALYRALGGGVK